MLVVAIVQLLKLMARPEGFEPPTPRSVEVLGAESRGSANRRYLLFLTFGHFCFMLIPTLLVQSGHKLVTSFLQREGFYLQTRNFRASYNYPTNNYFQSPETGL